MVKIKYLAPPGSFFFLVVDQLENLLEVMTCNDCGEEAASEGPVDGKYLCCKCGIYTEWS